MLSIESSIFQSHCRKPEFRLSVQKEEWETVKYFPSPSISFKGAYLLYLLSSNTSIPFTAQHRLRSTYTPSLFLEGYRIFRLFLEGYRIFRLFLDQYLDIPGLFLDQYQVPSLFLDRHPLLPPDSIFRRPLSIQAIFRPSRQDPGT